MIRTSGGFFYDRTGYIPMADLVLHNGTHLHNFLIEESSVSESRPDRCQPGGLVRLDPFHTGMSNARPSGVPRNSLLGPAYADIDIRLARDFYVSRAKKDLGAVGTFALDAFDALNHVNYPGYVGSLTSPFFGKAISALPTRRLLLSVRFKF